MSINAPRAAVTDYQAAAWASRGAPATRTGTLQHYIYLHISIYLSNHIYIYISLSVNALRYARENHQAAARASRGAPATRAGTIHHAISPYIYIYIYICMHIYIGLTRWGI